MIRKVLALLIAFAISLASFAVFAQTSQPAHPQPGMWWNPAESGRGWAIDPQGDVMTCTTFEYDNAGKMQWYVSTGRSERRLPVARCPDQVALVSHSAVPTALQRRGQQAHSRSSSRRA